MNQSREATLEMESKHLVMTVACDTQADDACESPLSASLHVFMF